jgi:hypothetical protein
MSKIIVKDKITNKVLEVVDSIHLDSDNNTILPDGSKVSTDDIIFEAYISPEDIQKQLDELDKKSIRDAEDLCDLLIKRGLIVAADVPFMKQRKDQKVTLREALKNIT